MAYMNQERKASIAEALKNVVPVSWKYSLAVRNHSTIVMTVRSAPVDIIAAALTGGEGKRANHITINPYWVASHFRDGEVRNDLVAILAALNGGNHDRSDITTDYFDVGWYVHLQIGTWNKPFIVA